MQESIDKIVDFVLTCNNFDDYIDDTFGRVDFFVYGYKHRRFGFGFGKALDSDKVHLMLSENNVVYREVPLGRENTEKLMNLYLAFEVEKFDQKQHRSQKMTTRYVNHVLKQIKRVTDE